MSERSQSEVGLGWTRMAMVSSKLCMFESDPKHESTIPDTECVVKRVVDVRGCVVICG